MHNSPVLRVRSLNAIAIVFFALVAVLFGPAAGATADEVGTDEYEFIFSGNVQFEREPIEGVRITVEGNGYSAEVETDAEGKWAVGVPEKAAYTITLDESTLPDGVIVDDEDGASQEREFGQTNRASVNFFIGEGTRVVVSFADQFLDRAMNGINFGLLLALASIGLSLIFGTTGLSNFAHAEMVTFGALIAYSLATVLVVELWVALPIAVIATGLFGWANDVFIWKPLRKRGVGLIPLMIVSIGLSIALRYFYQVIYGGTIKQLPGTGMTQMHWGPISLSWVDIWSMGISIVVLLAVAYFLVRTRLGKATRAVADNPSLASASGINVNRVIRIVWTVGGLLAGLSGVLWAYFRPGVSWDMGFQMLLLIFAAVILGGLGTAFGALLGSLIVGMLIELSTLWLASDLKYVGALGIMIVVLLFRPQGILGRRERIG